MTMWLTRSWLKIRHELSDDSGDVPGWVMVTLMTAGLVIVLWTVAGDRLAAVFNESMDRILRMQ